MIATSRRAVTAIVGTTFVAVTAVAYLRGVGKENTIDVRAPDTGPWWKHQTTLTRLDLRKLILKLKFDCPGGMPPFLQVSYANTLIPAAMEKEGCLQDGDAMHELLKDGPSILPLLLESLDDPTESNVVISNYWVSFSDEYEPRDRNAPRASKNIRVPANAKSYTLTVGDICYSLLGQIVNRNFRAVRGQPSFSIVVNSPSRSPDLASWVRSDWGRFTPDDIRMSLIEDVKYNGRVDSLAHLARYFPVDYEALALPLIARDYYDFEHSNWILVYRVLSHNTEQDRRSKLKYYQTKLGKKGFLGLVVALQSGKLHREKWQPFSEEMRQRIDSLRSWVTGCFPLGKDESLPSKIEELTYLLDVCSHNTTVAIENATADLLMRSDLAMYDGFDQIYIDDFVLACLRIVRSEAAIEKARSYLNGRADELRNRQLRAGEQQRLNYIVDWLNRH